MKKMLVLLMLVVVGFTASAFDITSKGIQEGEFELIPGVLTVSEKGLMEDEYSKERLQEEIQSLDLDSPGAEYIVRYFHYTKNEDKYTVPDVDVSKINKSISAQILLTMMGYAVTRRGYSGALVMIFTFNSRRNIYIAATPDEIFVLYPSDLD